MKQVISFGGTLLISQCRSFDTSSCSCFTSRLLRLRSRRTSKASSTTFTPPTSSGSTYSRAPSNGTANSAKRNFSPGAVRFVPQAALARFVAALPSAACPSWTMARTKNTWISSRKLSTRYLRAFLLQSISRTPTIPNRLFQLMYNATVFAVLCLTSIVCFAYSLYLRRASELTIGYLRLSQEEVLQWTKPWPVENCGKE